MATQVTSPDLIQSDYTATQSEQRRRGSLQARVYFHSVIRASWTPAERDRSPGQAAVRPPQRTVPLHACGRTPAGRDKGSSAGRRGPGGSKREEGPKISLNPC